VPQSIAPTRTPVPVTAAPGGGRHGAGTGEP